MADNSQQALQELQTYQGSLQTPQQAMDAANQTLGVTGAQNNVSGLRSAVQNTTSLLGQVAPNVYGRTQNSLVTSAQAGRQIQNESAPLQTTLGKETGDLNTAEDDYRTLVGQAQSQANNTLSAQNSKLGFLQNIYEDLYGKEKDAAALAEERRQFDADQAYKQAALKASSSSGSSGLSGLSSLLGSAGSSPATPTAAISQRTDKGYNFNYGGQAISAAQYAQLKGIPLRTLLTNMANSGDAGAKLALGYVGDDFGINKAKVGNNAQVKSVLNSILWGVNKI
jgi:hypothetical protein